jgi:transposase
MDENCLAYGIEISDLDWEKTPASVKQLVEKMGQHIKQSEKELTDLKAQQQELLEKNNRTSKNSSSPPSLDPPNAEKREEKKKRRPKLPCSRSG